MKKITGVFFLSFFATLLNAQTPVPKRSGQIKSPAGINNTAIKADTTPAINVLTSIKPSALFEALSNTYSLLQFSYYLAGGAEFESGWEFKKTFDNPITDNPLSKNWKQRLTWRKIPAGAVKGRWEISLLPFPPGDDPGFSGILRTGIVETKGSDSVYFEINYVDDNNAISRYQVNKRAANGNVAKVQPLNKIQRTKDSTANNGSRTDINTGNGKFSGGLKLYGDGTRKFYIRVIPLDAAGKPMLKISNDVTVQEIREKAWKQPVAQQYLENDYTITAVKYVPVHQPENTFTCCVVVTGYDESYPENIKESFKAGFPIGRVICPKPPQDKPWYEKAFNGITGFMTEAINKASAYYNDTKSYVKDKAISTLCSKAPAGTKGGCEIAAGAAFEYGMTAVGIPPTIPNVDDLTKMAEGQLTDLALEKIESESDFPIPEEAKAEFKKQFHDKVTTTAARGTMNNGILYLKPHPAGQFQTAYLEIEITRTGNKFNGQGIVNFGVNDLTRRVYNAWNPAEKNYQPVNLSVNLFERATATVPFLQNIGDKTKLFVVLKPQESYIWHDKNTGVVKTVNTSPQMGTYYTPPTPTYEGYTHTSGFDMMNTGSNTKFSFGLQVAPGISLDFTNK